MEALDRLTEGKGGGFGEGQGFGGGGGGWWSADAVRQLKLHKFVSHWGLDGAAVELLHSFEEELQAKIMDEFAPSGAKDVNSLFFSFARGFQRWRPNSAGGEGSPGALTPGPPKGLRMKLCTFFAEGRCKKGVSYWAE